MKTKKRKKSTRMRGTRLHGYAFKKHKGKGNKGGKGMAGTGKRADQKKTYVLKYQSPYFGKKGVTGRKRGKVKVDVINVGDIELRINRLEKDGIINLKSYKILGKGEIKSKVKIIARDVSKTAREKIEKAGGSVTIKDNNKEEQKDGSSKHTE